MKILSFILLNVMCEVGVGLLVSYLYRMMQPDGAFKIIGWDRLCEKLYGSENEFLQNIEKALGGCDVCTTFWWSGLFTIGSFYFIQSNGYNYSFWGNLFWFLILWAITAGFSLEVVNRRFKKKEDVM